MVLQRGHGRISGASDANLFEQTAANPSVGSTIFRAPFIHSAHERRWLITADSDHPRRLNQHQLSADYLVWVI